MVSGQRVQRYLCKTCRRTFSSNTGTPRYRIRKQDSWREMIELLADNLPLRAIASRLNIAVSTAFQWRHRALAVLSAQARRHLSGDVRVETFLVKYSEKGSRVCNGPGSWGYWNYVRRGPEPPGRPRPATARTGKHRFRLLVDGRPLHVMVAESDCGYELTILGQGRRTAEMVGAGLIHMVRPGSRVWTFFSGPEYREACEVLGYEYQCGIEALARRSGTTSRRPMHLLASWLRRFRGVATKYLSHYLAWFRDIVRIVQYPDGASIAPVDGRALLRCPTG